MGGGGGGVWFGAVKEDTGGSRFKSQWRQKKYLPIKKRRKCLT